MRGLVSRSRPDPLRKFAQFRTSGRPTLRTSGSLSDPLGRPHADPLYIVSAPSKYAEYVVRECWTCPATILHTSAAERVLTRRAAPPLPPPSPRRGLRRLPHDFARAGASRRRGPPLTQRRCWRDAQLMPKGCRACVPWCKDRPSRPATLSPRFTPQVALAIMLKSSYRTKAAGYMIQSAARKRLLGTGAPQSRKGRSGPPAASAQIRQSTRFGALATAGRLWTGGGLFVCCFGNR